MRKIGVSLFLLLTVFVLTGCGPQKSAVPSVTPSPTPSVKTLKLGEGPQVDLSLDANKQFITLNISSISADIKSIDYEIVYDTEGVQRGIIGSVNLNGETSVQKKHTLGSCSRNVCVIDKNVSKLNLTVKYTTSSEPLMFQKDYTL